MVSERQVDHREVRPLKDRSTGLQRLVDLFLLGGRASSWQDLHLGELRRKIGSDTAGKFIVD